MTTNPWFDRLLDVALSPVLWLGLALACVYGTLFAIWRRSGWRGWPRDLLVGIIGFAIGQAGGMLLGSTWLRVGDVQLLWGTLGSTAALIVGRWLQARGAPRQAARPPVR